MPAPTDSVLELSQREPAPSSDGGGAYRCMKAALHRAQLDPSDIDYINAHGTSTPLGDELERVRAYLDIPFMAAIVMKL